MHQLDTNNINETKRTKKTIEWNKIQEYTAVNTVKTEDPDEEVLHDLHAPIRPNHIQHGAKPY